MAESFTPNKAQLKAIEFGIDRPLKVIAGAGTGKTEVLTRRFVHLIEKYHMQPHRILALTFTKKAAAEMQTRITRALLDKGLMKKSDVALLSWIGNFHSISLKLLKQSPLVVGLDPSFTVIEEAEQRLVFADVVDDFLNKKLTTETNPDSFENLMIERVDEFADNVLRVVSRLKSCFITPESLKNTIGVTLSEQYRKVERILRETITNKEVHTSSRKKAERRLESLPSGEAYERLFVDALYEIYRAYQEKLDEQDTLDFNDLIFHAYRLATTDSSLKEKFQFILVDEFQDTDYGQYKLLEALSDNFKRITVVGDKKQSIYEWREARIENIENFPGKMIPLDENYRSFGEILDSANFFIGKSMPAEHPLKTADVGGRGRANAAQVKLVHSDSRETEAEYVAKEIRRLIAVEKYKAGEIVLLMRSVLASQTYEDALKAHGIRYVTVGSCGFYDLSETKDLLSLLRLISDPFDDLSMARVLQSAVIGLSDATLYSICARKNETTSIYDVLKTSHDLIESLRPETQKRLRKLVSLIDELANKKAMLTIGEVVSEALSRTEFLKYLASVERPRGPRFSNISRLYKMATGFEERRPSEGLEGFLSYVDAAVSGGVGETSGDIRADVVQIMTVHQAKGLEFPVVFVVNLGPKTFPLGFRQDNFGYDERSGLFARKLPRGEPLIRYEGGYGTNTQEDLRERHYLEENRIMYVAMTRARNILYLTTNGEQSGESEDFFQYMKAFASKSGGEGAELVSPPADAVEVPESAAQESEAVTSTNMTMTLEEIKELAARAVQRISPPQSVATMQGAGGMIGLSYSRLALFRHCPVKYALRYLYNLPLSPYEESQDENHPSDGPSAFELGNLLHKTLMLYHRRRKTGSRADAIQIFDDLCRASHCSKGMLQAGKALLKKYSAAPLSQLETLHEEKEFHWRITDGSHQIMFEGKIDRIHRQGDLLKIVDYKTGARDQSHKLQLGIYRLAMESVLGVQGILTSNFYLSTGEEIEYEFSPDELLEIRDGIIKDGLRIAKIDLLKELKAELTHNCSNCEYESFCPSK